MYEGNSLAKCPVSGYGSTASASDAIKVLQEFIVNDQRLLLINGVTRNDVGPKFA